MSKRQRTTEKLFSKAFDILSECPAPTKNGPKLVGTHDGTFHCDEALGCAMLQVHHTTPHHTTPHHTTPHHTAPHHTTPHRTAPHHTTPRRTKRPPCRR